MAEEEPTLGEDWELVGDGRQTFDSVCEALCRWVLRCVFLPYRCDQQKRPHQLQVRFLLRLKPFITWEAMVANVAPGSSVGWIAEPTWACLIASDSYWFGAAVNNRSLWSHVLRFHYKVWVRFPESDCDFCYVGSLHQYVSESDK